MTPYLTLIEKAEGYRDDAYPFGGILNNKRTAEINADAVEKLYNAYVQKLIIKEMHYLHLNLFHLF